jgi:hypothetical protein
VPVGVSRVVERTNRESKGVRRDREAEGRTNVRQVKGEYRVV